MPEETANDGNYICEVWNPVTNITMYTMKDVTFGGLTVTSYLATVSLYNSLFSSVEMIVVLVNCCVSIPVL